MIFLKRKLLALLRNPVALSSMIMFIGTMAVNLGAYLYHLVVGRILGPDKYGEFSSLFSLLFVISVPATVIQLVITKYYSQYKAKNDKENAKGFLLLVLKLLLVSGFVSFILYIPTIQFLENFLHINRFDNFIYLYLIFVTSFLLTICTGVLNGYQLFFASSGFMTINMIIRFLSGILLAPLGVTQALIGILITNVLTVILSILPMKFLLSVKAKYTDIPKMEAFRYMIPTFLATLSLTLLFNLDVVLVKHFFPSRIAGIYGALSIFGKIIFFASSAVSMVMFPMISERKTNGKAFNHLVYMGFAVVTGISLIIVFFYFVFSSVVSVLLFGKQFSEVSPYLGWYGLFMGGITVANYLLSVTLAANKVRSWVFVAFAALFQCVGIFLFHSDIVHIIFVNSVIAWLLSLVLLLYYRYERRKS